MKIWDQPGAYLGDFFARAGADWHHSAWDFRKIIVAGLAKVHVDVQFTRYRADNSAMARSAHYGSSPRPTDAGPWRRARTLRINRRGFRLKGSWTRDTEDGEPPFIWIGRPNAS
jgi:hypothetical protein